MTHLVERVVRDGLCIGCGMCTPAYPKGQIRLELDAEREQFVPVVDAGTPVPDDDDVVCPGAVLDMNGLSKQVFGSAPSDYVSGVVERVRVCYARDSQVRAAGASGGIIPAILKHLFEQGCIDVAYCLVPGQGPYDAKGRIIRSAGDLQHIHGSVYHPFDFGAELQQLVNEESGRFAFVGLPCQIAGLEMLKRTRPALARRHELSVGLFCGGINRFGAVKYYVENFGVPWDDVASIEYRYGKWPGRIRIRRRSSSNVEVLPRLAGNSPWRIMRYMAAFQGYWMLKRCRLCPDQLADFADIAVGDPHVPRYRKQATSGFSVVVTRTSRGEAVISALVSAGELNEEPADVSLVRQSQGYTLDNRRHVLAYQRVAVLLREAMPRLSMYPDAALHVRFRHYKYAMVDLLKIKIRRWTWLRPLYPAAQAFEYLFITLVPSLFVARLRKLLSNKPNA